jgi:ABC-type sulfate transport system permease component
MDQAMAAALLLVGVSFALFWALETWGRRHASP